MFRKLLIASFIFGSTISLSAQYQKPISVKDTITDKELMIPEEIERNFDQLLIDWKKDLKPSQTCNYQPGLSSDFSIPDSVYIDRLYSLPTEMEMVYNPIVRSYIEMYTGRRRTSVEYFLGKSRYFFPIFEQALDKYGIPLELKYLPIIESALKPTIVSRAGATGLWQFMIGTGKMYNLEINSLVDERRDPFLSSDAAARYLKDLHNIYGDWNLVIAAYNCGPGNVNKAIKRSGGATDYWEIYPYLPRETRGYVPAFIAAAYVMNYYQQHNICPVEYDYQHSVDVIEVDKYLHLEQLAYVLNIPIEDIRELNPQYKKDIVPGEFKKYIVTLPSTKATDFEVYRDSVYSYRTKELLAKRKVVEPRGGSLATGRTRHKVRRGETLSSIAAKHRVTVNQLKRWNGLKSTKLRIGQTLAINKPVPKQKAPEKQVEQPQLYAQNTNVSEPKLVTASITTEKSEIQDTPSSNVLTDYFRKQSQATHSIETEPALVETVNNESAENVVVAEEKVNRIPKEVQTIYHKVRIGETLSLIASKYDVEKEDISSWNNLKSVPKIGQRLIIHLPDQSEKTESQIMQEDIAQNTMLTDVSSGRDDGFEKYREAAPVSTVATLAELEQRDELNKQNSQSSVKQVKKSNTKRASQSTVYTVKKGDTLGHIAGKFGGKLTSKEIMRANKLSSDKLKIGQKLRIPR